MLLVFYIAGAIVFSAIYRIINRSVLKEHEPYAYAFLTQLFSVFLFLIPGMYFFAPPSDPRAWLVLALAGSIWTITAMISQVAGKKTELSIREPLGQSRVLWVFLFGVLFLGEVPTFYRFLGTIILFLGASLLVWHPERRLGAISDPGVLWTLFTALMSGIASIVDKIALQWFHPATYAFFVYAIPTAILFLFLHKRIGHVRHLLQNRGTAAVTAIILQAITYFCIISAFSLGDITLIYPLLQLGIVLTVFGGIFFLKERDHILQRVIATIVVIAGSIILRW